MISCPRRTTVRQYSDPDGGVSTTTDSITRVQFPAWWASAMVFLLLAVGASYTTGVRSEEWGLPIPGDTTRPVLRFMQGAFSSLGAWATWASHLLLRLVLGTYGNQSLDGDIVSWNRATNSTSVGSSSLW